MFRRTTIAAAAALLLVHAAPALAQSQKDWDELRAQVRSLSEQVGQLKAALSEQAKTAPANAPAADLGSRVGELEKKAQAQAPSADLPGSMRIPGSDTSLRVYGFAEAHVIHDLKATAPGDTFTNLMEQPLAQRDAGAPTGATALTAQSSRFGFETLTPLSPGLNLDTKVEADFYAYCAPGASGCDRYRLRLRHAYGQWGNWLIGQTWSTFMDLDNAPETVDFNGPIGTPFARTPMLRYSSDIASTGLKFTAAAEDPEAGAHMPNLVARLDKSFDWGNIAVRALAHQKRSAASTRNGAGFGFGFGLKLGANDLFTAQWAKVNGDANMMYGSGGYTVDTNGALVFDPAEGFLLGLGHSFGDTLRANVAFGSMSSRRVDLADGSPAFDNRRLEQLHLGFIYTPYKNVELGAEIIQGRRKTFDGDTGRLSRVDLMGRVSF